MKKLQYREYVLIIGIVLIFISFLFFGRLNEIYMLLLLIGVLLSFTSFLLILIGKRKFKTKLLWISIVIISVVFEIMLEPYLIKSSYLIFLNNNESKLNRMNALIKDCPDYHHIHNDSIYPSCEELNASEKAEIFKLMKDSSVLRIEKNEEKIFFELWGMLDTRLGIYFNRDNEQEIARSSLLKGNWYY